MTTKDPEPMTEDSTDLMQAPASGASDIVTPASARALFWRPRYLRASPGLVHLPFLFWLIDLARPRIMAEIGTGDGVSYFAACQAMDRLGHGAGPGIACHGTGDWPDGAVPDDLAEHNAANYADVSRLSGGGARALVARLPEGQVDLLSLHGVPDTDEALPADWARKLSPRGVVLFHGVADWPGDGPERRALEKLAMHHPTISFEAGSGLVAVLTGADQPDRLTRLARLDMGVPGAGEVHHVFRRLGAAIHHEWAAGDGAARADAAQARAAAAETALTEARATGDAAARDLARLRDDHATQARDVAVLEARLEGAEASRDNSGLSDVLRQHSAAATELGGLRARLAAAEARVTDSQSAQAAAEAAAAAARAAQAQADQAAVERLAAKDQALRQLGAQIAAARTEAEAARARSDATDELRSFTTQLEASREDRDAVNRSFQTLKVAHAQLKAEAERLRADLDGAHAHIDAVMRSTSWKLTRPARGLITGLRRLRRGGGDA